MEFRGKVMGIKLARFGKKKLSLVLGLTGLLRAGRLLIGTELVSVKSGTSFLA
jgi:hypothetical protein